MRDTGLDGSLAVGDMPYTLFAGGAESHPGDDLLLENGSDIMLMEDGTSSIKMES